MSLEIEGKILELLPEQNGEGKNGPWRKRSFVIETEDQYPKKVCFDVWGDRIDTLDSFSMGSSIKVAFDVESREYNGKWYTNAKAWRMEAVGGGNAGDAGRGSTTNKADDPFPDDLMSTSSNDDDLPF